MNLHKAVTEQASYTDFTCYFLIADVVCDNVYPSLQLLTFNPVSCNVHFTGDMRDPKLRRMVQSVIGLGAEIFDCVHLNLGE